MNALALVDLERVIGELGTRRSSPPVSANVSPIRPAFAGAGTGTSIATLVDVLAHIPSDTPRGMGNVIGPDGQPVEDYWFGVVLACRREFGPHGESVVREWSERSPRYSVDGFDSAWKAFEPDHPNPVTFGSVLVLARSHGWSGDVTSPVIVTPVVSRYKLLSRTAIMAIQPTEWSVKGLFPVTGMGGIYGPSGSGKSFLAIDLAVHIASGKPWFGRRTKATPVAYVMLEGEAGLQNRLIAWERQNSAEISDAFKGLIQSFCISSLQDVEDLAAALPVGGVVIIDTLNRASPGRDENNSKDMGQILAGMKRLQEVTRGLVLVVHHTGKDASKGMRGHSSLYAALDGAIEVQRNGAHRSWNAAKVKDGIDGESVDFSLKLHTLGYDEDYDEITSCAISHGNGTVTPMKEPSGGRQRAALDLIRRTLCASPVQGMGGCGSETACIKVEDAIDEVAGSLTTVERSRRRARARTIVQSLIDGLYLQTGLDDNEEGWVWWK